jgi:glucose-6-phosphate isomerase
LQNFNLYIKEEKYMSVKFINSYAKDFISDSELSSMVPRAVEAQKVLMSGSGLGNERLGWLTLPEDYDKAEFEEIKKTAKFVRENADVLVVIGIGGSYLGARAVIEAVKSPNYNLLNPEVQILFIGNSISPSSLNETLKLCEGKDICVNVISKSGTTTEPAVAFRVFRELVNSRYSKEEAAKRIFCTTDKNKGTLKELADREGYKTFVVPDDVGGRYSVLTAVGLLPIACAGIDIDKLMLGARDAMNALVGEDINKNAALRYAAIRNIFYDNGKKAECFVSYEPSMAMFNEWLKQLFGESEGKDGKGLYPTSVIFSTDLHSLGQFIQESGKNILFETVINFARCENDYVIPVEEGNIDGLNFLAGENMSTVNQKARLGTLIAHTDGEVPNLVVEAEIKDEYNIGYLIYFFEKSCAISGYILGVNPFDQPGVESYKKNMFALLGKPGYESEKERLEKRLGL